MKPIMFSPLFRKALLLPALGLMLAPVAAQSRERQDLRELPDAWDLQQGADGRAGAIEEFNFGPAGTDVMLQRQDRSDEGGTRLLSGRVIELDGRTLYVERSGVVVPLDVSALRIHKPPKEGQQIIASYTVDRTNNVALSLAGEVAPPDAPASSP